MNFDSQDIMQKIKKKLHRFVYPFICIKFYLIFVSTTLWLKEKRKKEREREREIEKEKEEKSRLFY